MGRLGGSRPQTIQLAEWWAEFDEKFMRPVFSRGEGVSTPPGLLCTALLCVNAAADITCPAACTCSQVVSMVFVSCGHSLHVQAMAKLLLGYLGCRVQGKANPAKP